MLNSNYSRI